MNYFEHKYFLISELFIIKNWQISLGRRFRSLKLWFVMRIYGAEGLQKHIKDTIRLAEFFEMYIRSDNRFEIVTEVTMGLVCFRIKVHTFSYRSFIN